MTTTMTADDFDYYTSDIDDDTLYLAMERLGKPVSAPLAHDWEPSLGTMLQMELAIVAELELTEDDGLEFFMDDDVLDRATRILRRIWG